MKRESDQREKGDLSVKQRLKRLLTNDTDFAFPKHALSSVTDCNDGRSIPSFRSILTHHVVQNTPLRKRSCTLLQFPHTTIPGEEDLAFNAQFISLLFNNNAEYWKNDPVPIEMDSRRGQSSIRHAIPRSGVDGCTKQ